MVCRRVRSLRPWRSCAGILALRAVQVQGQQLAEDMRLALLKRVLEQRIWEEVSMRLAVSAAPDALVSQNVPCRGPMLWVCAPNQAAAVGRRVMCGSWRRASIVLVVVQVAEEPAVLVLSCLPILPVMGVARLPVLEARAA
jgi:hypothetical protein